MSVETSTKAALTSALVGVTIWTAQAAANPSEDQIRRLQLQHVLDYNAPLYDATFIGTHNSFSSRKYYLTFVNQQVDLKTQLDNGARALNFDLKKYKDDPGGRIFLCHGTCVARANKDDYPFGLLSFENAMWDVAEWLIGHGDEMLIIVLESSLGNGKDESARLYTEALAEIRKVLGDQAVVQGQSVPNRVYAPKDYSGANSKCRELPLQDLTKQTIVNSGRSALFMTRGCALDTEHAWNDWVWQVPVSVQKEKVRDPVHMKQPLRTKVSWTFSPEDRCKECVPTRHEIDGSTFANLLSQGSAVLGLDKFVTENRHEDLIWSWLPGEPGNSSGNKGCAVQTASGRWSSRDCAGNYHHACENSRQPGSVEEQWKVSTSAGLWSDGPKSCTKLGSDWRFSVPINARQNAILKSMSSGKDLWLNYASDEMGQWGPAVNFPAVPALPSSAVFTFDVSSPFRHFEVPVNTSYKKVEFRIRGGKGGNTQVTRSGKADDVFTSSGGDGASFTVSYAIGDGDKAIPGGSQFGIVVGKQGENDTPTTNCKKKVGILKCDRVDATGGGGGGSAVLLYRPVSTPPARTPWGSWTTLAVAGGGGGAYVNQKGRSDKGDSATEFVSAGNGSGGNSGPTGCSGGGGGARSDGKNNLKGGKAGGRTYGEGGAVGERSVGGLGYGGGAASGAGSANGAGGGGGYSGGDGGRCGTIAEQPGKRGGGAGTSYRNKSLELSFEEGAFEIPTPSSSSGTDTGDGVIVVTLSSAR